MRKKNKHPDWQMSKSERSWYYVGDIGRMFATAVLAQYLTVFLMFQNINVATVATSMLVVKIIDALDDVLFGYFVDRFDPRKIPILGRLAGVGKYMPWYRSTFWSFPLATVFFFLMPKDIPEFAKIVWFTVFYLLYDLTCTLSEVPMNSMVMSLTENPTERNHILTVKGVISVIAGIFYAVIAQLLISEAVGFSVTSVAVVSSIIFLILMTPMCFKVKEHNIQLKNVEEDKEKDKEKYSVKDMLCCVFTNKYIFIYFASVLITSCLATGAALQTFIGFYIFNDSNIYSIIMLIAFVPGIVISAFCGKIADKFGKRNTLMGITLLSGICLIIQYFLFGKAKVLFIIVGAVCAIPNALFVIARQYIAPDTIEYTRYKTGKDCSGIFYSLNSFLNKVTAGFASSLGLYIISAAGWKEIQAESFADLAAQGVQQSEAALTALWSCGYLIPAIGSIVGALLLLFYNLKDKDAELMAKCNAGLITREECAEHLSRKY